MPKGLQHRPNIETKLTAVSMVCNGKKVQMFLNLPIINNKAVLPREKFNELADQIGAERGNTISMG